MEVQDATQHLQEIVKVNRIAMFTTIADDGMLQSRPMVVQEREFDGDLWFFTSEESGKTGQIKHNTQVNVSFSDTKANRYLSLSGTAWLVHDRAKFAELWAPAMSIYFPDGLDDPNLVLVKVSAQSIAWWEGASTFLGRVASMVKAWVKHDPSELGDSGAEKV